MNISFFCNKHKTLSRLELNFKRRIIVVEVRFENYTWIFPSFRRGIFDQVMRLDHSRTSKIFDGSYTGLYIHFDWFL